MENKALKLSLMISVVFILFSCKNNGQEKKLSVSPEEEELYRPNFHFTPQKGWMNDPNGMFYYEGYYHLYFQHYPDDNVWGPMHWGHAISTDLVNWREMPIALYPDSLGYIFSGSAVVDTNNTSGFGSAGNPPVIAMFTYHDAKAEKEGKEFYQTQGIAYSLDQGLTWTKYADNPVIDNPGIRDFRDPKVIWDEKHKQWLMVLAAGDRAMFYSSGNLKKWELLSTFGENTGSHDGVWECPDFLPMKVEDTDEIKWVLIQSINPGGPNGGSATQYFVGDFDGKTFVPDAGFQNDLKSNKARWIDYGKDNYAGVTWSNIPDGRKLFMGWMSNWQYARQVPTYAWRSSMTIPRELKLIQKDKSYRLTSQPVKELDEFVSNSIGRDNLRIQDETVIVDKVVIDLTKADIRFDIPQLKEDVYTFSLSNSKGEKIRFGLNNIDNYFFIDRKNSGKIEFSEKFADSISKIPLEGRLGNLNVRILVDKTSVEIFYNQGEFVMTEIFFPNVPFDAFTIKAKETEIKNLKINQLFFN